jgi:hypothetical protein
MARLKPGTGDSLALDDDQTYQGVLISAKVAPSKVEGWKPQLEVEWELRQGAKLRDWIGLGLTLPNSQPTKLRLLLNALGEKPKDEELWFDPDTLEWGYDLDGDDSTPAYAALRPGLVVMFKGENRANPKGGSYYRITGYRSPTKVKPR